MLPPYETGSPEYKRNYALFERLAAKMPRWKDMLDANWTGFVVKPDDVGRALEPFLIALYDYWQACAGNGWPVGSMVQDDMTETITTLQTMLAEMQKIAPPQMQCGVTSRLASDDEQAIHQKYRDATRKRAIYELYLDEIECGPFDGGCWAFAHAAQEVYGGELWTLVGTGLGATCGPIGQHVVLRKGKHYFDADGWSTPEELLERWRREEHIQDPTLRPFQENDVPGSPRIRSLVDRTVELLTEDVPPSEGNIDDAAWDPVWTAFALRHEVRSDELTAEDSVIDLAAFEAFIEPARIEMETAYALVDGVPHVAGWTGQDYQFWVYDLSDHVVVIEDQPYCGCYCLPPLREWPNFWKVKETPCRNG